MKRTHLSFISLTSLTLALLPLSMLVATPAMADDDGVLHPPTTVHESEDARQPLETGDDEANLTKELAPPENLDGAEVRSFTRKDGADVTEYSVKGRVYMIKVQPPGNLPAYYLYDNDGDGVFDRRLPGGYKHPSPPMWIIKKF